MDPVRAAGGVLWRYAADDGRLQVALVHRPRYDDWSLPKGKLNRGESFAEAALREVEEETGQRAELGEALGEIHYVHRGRDKVVRYWSMRALGGHFVGDHEVDRVRWLDPRAAASMLTYDRDRDVLERFVDAAAVRIHGGADGEHT